MLSGEAWDFLLERKIAFTRQRNYGREARQAQWAAIANTASIASITGTTSSGSNILTKGTTSMGREVAEKARRRAEIAR